tara:strand:+ start:689 stop:952 length:264 start_codon:yes stop_codon:yes gene_type:complete
MNENIEKLDFLNKAIRVINPDAEYQATSIDDIIWMNGTSPISKADIETKIDDIKVNGTVEEQKKASGKQKLKDLGLDDDEIQALMGA